MLAVIVPAFHMKNALIRVSIRKGMGIQTGSITFKGKLGNVVGRMVNGTPVIQTLGGFTSENLRKGRKKQYARVFENANEFAYSTNLAKAIHYIPDASIHKTHHGNHAFQKLISKIHQLRTLDAQNPRGQRRPTTDTLKYLVSHQFNPPAARTIRTKLTYMETDPENLSISLTDPLNNLLWPDSASGVELIAYTAQLDPDLQRVTQQERRSQVLLIQEAHQDLALTAPLLPSRSLLIVAIRFCQVLGDLIYPLADASFSPMQIGYWKE
jgi:hypothetical protein